MHPSLEGGPAAAPPRPGAHRRAVGRADGPDARLHERHVRRLRRGAAGVARAGRSQRGGRARTSPPSSISSPARTSASPTRSSTPPSTEPATSPSPATRCRCTRWARPSTAIVVRGARILATLAPVRRRDGRLPGPPAARPTRPPQYALSFSIPMDTPGLDLPLPRQRARRRVPIRSTAPLSSRFDEQDAFVHLRRRRGARPPRVHRRRPRRLQLGDGPNGVVAEHHAADHHPGPDEAGVRLRPGHASWPRRSTTARRARSRCSASCTATSR